MAKGMKTGGGSRKGKPNKETKQLREMILGAFNTWKAPDGKGGGEEWLKRQMDKNPAAFMALLGKVLPMQVQGSGEDGELIVSITRRIVK
jgi:hypothetical protein